jgi:hypothetical protein
MVLLAGPVALGYGTPSLTTTAGPGESEISVEPFIMVTSPDGGETWNRGLQYEITWESYGAGLRVKISLYNGPARCCTISSDTENDNSFRWTIPAGHPTGSNYRVVVISQSVPGLYGYNDPAFTIAEGEPEYITVTAPNGGETCVRGSTEEITWGSDGEGRVKIRCYKGGSYHCTMTLDTDNDGSYSWPIPPEHDTGGDFRVVIISKSVPGLYDYSDAPYSIVDSTALLTVQSSPMAGIGIRGTSGQAVTLIAPWTADEYIFQRWKDADGHTLSHQSEYDFTVTHDTTAVAEYSNAVTDFYVNDEIAEPGFAAGNNANSGTSPNAPMAGIQALLERYQIGAGCTVHVSDGTFVECVLITAPWQAGLVIEGAGPGRTIVVQDPENLDGYPAFYVMRNCTVRMLSVCDSSTGVYCEASNLVLVNCILSGNTTALWSFYDDPVITNCTFQGNQTALQASRSSIELRNCIFWGNDTEITAFTSTWDYLWLYYCDIEGGESAVSTNPNYDVVWHETFDADPLFADPAGGDLHLCSIIGRWNPATQTWVADAVHSPCIDGGDPLFVFSTEPSPNGGCINAGAYGNTEEASKSGLPFIAVITPVGGQTWYRDSTHEITWASYGAGPTVRISLYDGPTRCCAISGGTENDGSFRWTIPAGHATGSNYRVVVISQSVPGLYGYNDPAFTIAEGEPEYITVTAPNGGENWNAGTTHSVTWNSNAGGTVDISLYKGGVFDSAIATGEANDGSYSWAIPPSHETAATFRVVVVSKAVGGLYDYSDGPFTIAAP